MRRRSTSSPWRSRRLGVRSPISLAPAETPKSTTSSVVSAGTPAPRRRSQKNRAPGHRLLEEQTLRRGISHSDSCSRLGFRWLQTTIELGREAARASGAGFQRRQRRELFSYFRICLPACLPIFYLPIGIGMKNPRQKNKYFQELALSSYEVPWQGAVFRWPAQRRSLDRLRPTTHCLQFCRQR
jgi:hypothetical protein